MLHFSKEEFASRRERLLMAMSEAGLDAVALFAQESMYWLTGYDTFGFCFFQCLVVKSDGDMALLTPLRRFATGATHLKHRKHCDLDGQRPCQPVPRLA